MKVAAIMGAKHTAGPWNVRVKPTGTGCQAKVECAAGYVVAEAFSSPSCNIPYKALWAEAEANARLIAAAPDLLAQLLNLVDALETDERPNRGEVAAARAVIKKAIVST